MPLGTVITVFQSTPAQLSSVVQVLQNGGFPYEQKETTFFTQLGFMNDYNNVVTELRALPLVFSALLIYDTTGSAFFTGNIDAAEVGNLRQLLGIV